MNKINPSAKIQIAAMETQVCNMIRNEITHLQQVGILVGPDYKKVIKKFDKWLLSYGLKYQPTETKLKNN